MGRRFESSRAHFIRSLFRGPSRRHRGHRPVAGYSPHGTTALTTRAEPSDKSRGVASRSPPAGSVRRTPLLRRQDRIGRADGGDPGRSRRLVALRSDPRRAAARSATPRAAASRRWDPEEALRRTSTARGRWTRSTPLRAEVAELAERLDFAERLLASRRATPVAPISPPRPNGPRHAAAGLLPRRDDLRAMLRLAGPVVVIQVGMMLMGVVDTVMVGHLVAAARRSPRSRSGNLYFFGLGVFGMGTLMVLDPVVAQAVGAGDDRRRRPRHPARLPPGRSARRPVAAVLLLRPSLFMTLRAAARRTSCRSRRLRRSPGARRAAVLPLHRPPPEPSVHAPDAPPIVLAIVVANLANAALNWLLIFGNLGRLRRWACRLRLGHDRSAGGCCSRVLLALAWRRSRPHLCPASRRSSSGRRSARMLGSASRSAASTCSSSAPSPCGADDGLARHPTDGRASGRHQSRLAHLHGPARGGRMPPRCWWVTRSAGAIPTADAGAARAALLCGVGFMIVHRAGCFSTAARRLARLYTDDSVLGIAVALFRSPACSRCSTAPRRSPAGSCAASGETRVAMLVNLLGLLVLRPAGELRAGLPAGLGPVGLWWGLVLGPGAVATRRWSSSRSAASRARALVASRRGIGARVNGGRPIVPPESRVSVSAPRADPALERGPSSAGGFSLSGASSAASMVDHALGQGGELARRSSPPRPDSAPAARAPRRSPASRHRCRRSRSWRSRSARLSARPRSGRRRGPRARRPPRMHLPALLEQAGHAFALLPLGRDAEQLEDLLQPAGPGLRSAARCSSNAAFRSGFVAALPSWGAPSGSDLRRGRCPAVRGRAGRPARRASASGSPCGASGGRVRFAANLSALGDAAPCACVTAPSFAAHASDADHAGRARRRRRRATSSPTCCSIGCATATAMWAAPSTC